MQLLLIYASLFRQKQAVKNKQTRKIKQKINTYSERNQHNTTIVTLRMHMAISMIRRKQNIPMANYIQKNVCIL